MIQLVRHQFSRKRGALSGFLNDEAIHDHLEERKLLEIVREDQLDLLSMPKKKSAMDLMLTSSWLNTEILQPV